MRELKFRAWDKQFKDMVGCESVIIHNGRPLIRRVNTDKKDSYTNINLEEITYAREWEVMQFTGLKDKNGKEIYEGDILLNDYYGKSQIIVKWIADGFNVNLLSKGGAKKCEIIGNIYQNSELIQQSTKEGMK